MQSSHEVVNLVVGGNNFCFKKEDLERFPDSYFAHFLKYEWRYDKSDDIYIDCDGWLFYNVFAYVVSDSLEFRPTTFDLETLIAIRREADFYNLPGMTVKCDEKISAQLQQWGIDAAAHAISFLRFACEPEYATTFSPTFRALNNSIRAAIAATGTSKLNFNLPSFSNISKISDSSNQRCSLVSNRFTVEIRQLVQAECRTWLLVAIGDKRIRVRQKDIYLYSTGDYCKQRMPMYTADGVILKGVTLLIPRTCIYTGGKITAVGCGQTMSIDKPGECMCIAAGMMYSVETVTSGNLVVMETEFYIETRTVTKMSATIVDNLTFTAYSTYLTDLKVSINAVKAALNTELRNYPAGVVICLTSLYPITHSPDPDNNHIYTDPEALKGKDADFCTILCEEYAVSVVTVFLCRTNTLNTATTATTSSPATSTATSNSTCSSTLVGCIVDNSLPEIEEGAMYKIVPVVHGYGEIFRLDDQKLGTLLTGTATCEERGGVVNS